MNLYRTILPIPDIERASAFYQQVFGETGERVSPGRHYFRIGGTVLALYDPHADGDEMGNGWSFHENQYLYFSVKNLPEVFQKCLEAGAYMTGASIEQMPWGETLFYAKDPFGTPLCFVQSGTEFLGVEETV